MCARRLTRRRRACVLSSGSQTAGLARRGCGTVAGMHPPRVASAAWVFASSPSKVPFYVAGGLLVGWAVLVSAWGFKHHEFPGSVGRARLVMLTSATLV